MTALELKDVRFSYPNGFEALCGLNLKVGQGEKVAIIGENGAGKTTMAKMTNGLLRPASGEVLVNGQPTAGRTVAAISRNVGYVFQNPDDQICNQSIFKEITYTLRYNKTFPPEEIRRRANEVLELVGMGGMGETNPYDISFSHRKFVTIASVILQDPDIVLLDEPTAGQDRVCMERLADVIDMLHGQGKAVITITHDMSFVVRHFDRVVVMAHGEIIADASPREIFWDMDILKEAALSQPYISALAYRLGLPGNVLTVDEFIDAVAKA